MTGPMRAPDGRWRIGDYEFERSSFLPSHRWGCVNRRLGRGTGHSRTPVGAFFRLLRWQKQPARPIPGKDGQP